MSSQQSIENINSSDKLKSNVGQQQSLQTLQGDNNLEENRRYGDKTKKGTASKQHFHKDGKHSPSNKRSKEKYGKEKIDRSKSPTSASKLPSLSSLMGSFKKSLESLRILTTPPEALKNASDKLKEWRPRLRKRYGYRDLFRCASAFDYTLMIVGSIAAVLSGFCIPLIIYLLGNLIRVNVLVNKMMHALECKGTDKFCENFWQKCEQERADSNYNEKEFLKSPTPNFEKIKSDHLEYFIEVELGVTIGYILLSCIYFFCWNYAAHNQGGKIRRAFFLSLLHKDQTWFNLQKDFEGLNRTMENTLRIEDGIGEEVPVAISLTVMCCVCWILAMVHGFLLSVVTLVTVPLLLVTTWWTSSAQCRTLLTERRAYRLAHELVKEVLSRMRTVIMYQSQNKEQLLYRREMTRQNKSVHKAILLQALATSTMYFLNFGAWAEIFWYGTANVLYNHENCSDKPVYSNYDAGDMFVIILSIIFGCGNVYLVGNVWKAVQVAKLCGAEVFKVIDGSIGIDGLSMEGYIPIKPLKGKIEFRDVRFTYPGKHEDFTLNHMTFVAEPKTLIALVGLQGSGKSTILKLICKEYLPDSGFIVIDNIDIKALNVSWLRSRIGFVPQDLTLFDMTVEDNIRMGNWEATFMEIQDACMKTGAHDFIMSFKGGYQKRIGHKGCLLTPFQQQLICITRALVRDPKILLLDEPAFSLDSKATLDFMLCLKNIATNRTVILVAHRLSTIIYADQIYVIKKGRVIEKGTHKRLLKAQGAYTNLCTMNRPSQSIQVPSYLEEFDSSEMSIISLARIFNVKPILQNLYNDMLSMNPVVSKVTYAILKNSAHTTQGFHEALEWTLEEEDPAVIDSKDDVEEVYETRLKSSDDQFATLPSGNNVLSPSIATIKEEITTESELGKRIEKQGEYERLSSLNTLGLSWLRILIMASPSTYLIVIGVICSLLLAVPMPAFGLIFALVINIVSDATLAPTSWSEAKTLGNEDHVYARWTIAAIAFVAVYMGFLSFFQELTLNICAFQSVQKLRRITHSSIMKQDMNFFEDTQDGSPKLASVLLQDAHGIRHLSISVYGTLVQTLLIFIVAVAFCIYWNLNQSFYVILIVTFTVAVNLVDGWLARKQYGRTIRVLDDMSTIILEVFRSKHAITVCQMEAHFAQVFTNLQRKSLRIKKSLSCLRIITFDFGQTAVFWGLGAVLEVNKSEIVKSRSGFVNAMAVGFVLVFGLATLGTNLSVLMGFSHVAKGAKRILKIINRKEVEITQENQISVSEDECNKFIEFVHTDFWRPYNPDRVLLKGVNLVIPSKKVTAIVGSPESGKDGFLDILGQYYNSTGGIVALNGNDLRFFTTNSLRERISVVTKEPQIFSRTVAQNIAIGDNSRPISMDDIMAVAKEANVHNFIVSLPEGYETKIGGEQDYLSGGQKYKITIARALLKKPKILIIDDLTTLLDKEGEASVLESLTRVKKDRTVIILSHRIDPIRDADRIAVMENGYLEEVGTHRGLLSRRPNGIYAHMWKSQHPMEDEKFVKGTVSFYNKIVAQYASASLITAEDTPLLGEVMNVSKSAPALMPMQKTAKQEIYDDEEEKSAGCWGGFLGAIGLNIVENESRDGLLD